MTKLFRWGDVVILALAALLALGAVAVGAGSRAGTGPLTAEVYHDGKLERLIPLDTLAQMLVFDVDGAYHNEIAAESGRIRFTQADCPDQTCVHTGWIAQAGQIAACVPNRVLVKVVGSEPPEEDVVVR